MEGNKLIAEFMGGYTPYERFGNSTEYYYNGGYVYLNDMHFHSSWDWLMPVVDKIESLRDENGNAYRFTIDMGNAQIEGTNIEIVGGSCKLDTTYQAVVEFIKDQNN